MYICMYIRTYVHICTYIHVYNHTYIHTYVRTHIHAYVSVQIIMIHSSHSVAAGQSHMFSEQAKAGMFPYHNNYSAKF